MCARGTCESEGIMAYFVITEKKAFEKQCKKDLGKNITWQETYGDWKCDICGENLKPGDRYFIVRTPAESQKEGKSQYRHILCDPDFLNS